MVLPKAGYIARSVITKSLNHGYIQSVVAASQSSYAAHHNNLGQLSARLGKSHTLHGQHHGAFSGDRHPGTKQQQEASLKDAISQWQQQKKLGKDWEQFQFAKRIEWKPHNLLAESRTDGKEEVKKHEEETQEPDADKPIAPKLDRSLSTSAFDDLLKLVDEQAADASLASDEEPRAITTSSPAAGVAADTSIEQRTPTASTTSASADSPQSSAASVLTPLTSVSQADVYTDQLVYLAGKSQYAEIPAVFEGMLHAGIRPTAQAYNALLLAAIALPKSRHQVVPKALDVYSDMLKRSVAPDQQTYSILIELLSTRALEVQESKSALEDTKARFGGFEKPGHFMLPSENFESSLLSEDHSLNLALRMFDAAIMTHPKAFAERTYRLLISALAEQNQISDMVHVYQQMEARRIVPRPELFVNMIQAFATSGDLRSAIECYDEYKALAIANDKQELSMVRNDDEVYAALVKAHIICGEQEGAERFFGKLQAVLAEQSQALSLRETITLRAYVAQFLKDQKFEDAFSYASEQLSGVARDIGLSAVCVRAADRNSYEIAARAFSQLSTKADIALAAVSMVAMHIRSGNLDASEPFWNILERAAPRGDFIQPTAMRTVALVGSGQVEDAIPSMRKMFARIRQAHSSASLMERIDEAIEMVGSFMSTRGIFLGADQTMEFLWTMVENHGLVPSVANHLLAGLGPDEIAQLTWSDLQLLAQVQGSMILTNSEVDVAHESRFAHMLGLLRGGTVDAHTTQIIEKTLTKVDAPMLWSLWLQQKHPHAPLDMYQNVAQTSAQPAFDESLDPYAATTDNRGSVAITDLLEKTYGRFSSHLNEAMARLKNMRRAGRHPRYFAYAKMITAAAKENRLQLASDVLALARQDVPLLPQYRIVRHGWISILDAMVAACLTTGRRDSARQYHQELSQIGAAPSANTFGLYITTLKESTKTFDEASEAVKIFLQAKAEGVEPSSFLYNALIGKLGKARRIDDCLFYFQEMRKSGIRATSVTYGTIVNALCRVSDEKFAEELFEEMESMPNYKPRPAPYHSMMQFFLSTKRDRGKVLAYYERMRVRKIQPTAHTYKLLIDTYATLQPIDMASAEAVLEQIQVHGELPEAVHYASLIHAKGCVLRDMEGARTLFDSVIEQTQIRLQPCLFQALFESMVANNVIEQSEPVLSLMRQRHIDMTPYIANALIHGWARVAAIDKVETVFNMVRPDAREPSTYEAMTRAYISLENQQKAAAVVNEALSRGYPVAVANKISDLIANRKAEPEQ